MRASIIISTYSISKLKYIIKTIEKCAENDVEFIITVERDKKYFDTLMDKLKKLKKRINLSAKLILHERRLNLSQARNLGMNFSSGDILIFLDDDVVPANDCIREIIKTFKERDDAAIVGSRVELSIPRNIIFPKIFYTLLGGQY
ncbi:MAG: glycosyltransferase, partial [Candidatus Baldrarchaeia archaeon]